MAKHTIIFDKRPRILSTGTVAGPKECAGVVGRYVDKALADDMFGESTYEKAECKMLAYADRQSHRKRGHEGRGYRYDDFGRFAQSDHFRLLCGARFRFPLSGRVRRLFDDVGEPRAGGGPHRRGILQTHRRRDGEPFFLGGTAVPVSSGTRQHPSAAVAVDGDGRGRRGRRGRGKRYRRHGRDVRESGGFRDHGRKQHGRGDGARRPAIPSSPICGIRAGRRTITTSS